MNQEDVFRISVLDAGRLLLRHVSTYPDVQFEDAIRQLKFGPSYLAGYDFDRALSLIQSDGARVFALCGDRTEELRHSIFELARSLRPFWARASVFGRQRVLRVLNENQMQCLTDAGLLQSPLTGECREWWERLALELRSAENSELKKIGSSAERLTLEFEIARLEQLGIERQPELVAGEDDTLGYDVASFDLVDGSVRPKFIESKGTTASEPRFFVSRNEWNACLRFGSLYAFYVWHLPSKTLTVIDREELQPHVPQDCGSGIWLDARFSIARIVN